MRIFRDLDMVEYLGSGMPRILRAYPKDCFRFSVNFTRMIFPFTEAEITAQVTAQVTGQSGRFRFSVRIAILLPCSTALTNQACENSLML